MSEVMGFFIGMGFVLVAGAFSYLFYQLARDCKYDSDFGERYIALKIAILTSLAKKKSYDIDKEIARRNVFQRRTFRKELEKQMIEEMFGKEKETKER